MELTNRQLMYIISVALVITLFGTAINLSRLGLGPEGLTGAATTAAGNASVTINALTSMNMTFNNISWGAGSVDGGAAFAVLDTHGSGYVSDGSWTPAVGSGFIIENIGNVDLNITFTNVYNATQLIGGTAPRYNYTITEFEGDSCDDVSGSTLAADWTVNHSNTINSTLCANLSFVDSKDMLEINLNITIPYDSLTGYKEDIWTVTAAQTS